MTLCRSCLAELTETDSHVGRCTQCNALIRQVPNLLSFREQAILTLFHAGQLQVRRKPRQPRRKGRK